jgi:hypothetical protein
MFEKRHHPLVSTKTFILRIIRGLGIGLFLISIALFIGMWGYHYFEQMTWLDAFANASMILSGMGPFGPLTTAGGKIFAGLYALFSGLAFILIVGIIFAPIVHRFFHAFHLDDQDFKK